MLYALFCLNATEPERNYTQLVASQQEIDQYISAPLPAFQFSSGLIPGFPHFPVSVSRDPSNKFKQKPPLVELCAMSLAFWPCFSFLASSVMSAPEILSPYYLFDILVRCFSYCCPTLVVRWAVLLSKTLDRWTGLYYQRWVSVPAAKWGAITVGSWMFSFHLHGCSLSNTIRLFPLVSFCNLS